MTFTHCPSKYPGSGKSSLLKTLLSPSPLHKISGSLSLFPFNPKVGYAGQVSWLLNATIRDNIVFGEEWDAKRYDKVIKASQLSIDFQGFEFGDLQQVGERGYAISTITLTNTTSLTIFKLITSTIASLSL